MTCGCFWQLQSRVMPENKDTEDKNLVSREDCEMLQIRSQELPSNLGYYLVILIACTTTLRLVWISCLHHSSEGTVIYVRQPHSNEQTVQEGVLSSLPHLQFERHSCTFQEPLLKTRLPHCHSTCSPIEYKNKR